MDEDIPALKHEKYATSGDFMCSPSMAAGKLGLGQYQRGSSCEEDVYLCVHAYTVYC